MSSNDDLIAREQQFWHAAGDPDFYREHFAEEGRCVFSFAVLDKTATVASMDGAAEWAEVDMSNVDVIMLTDDVAALTYTARATDVQGQGYEANVSSVYVRRQGDWELAVHVQVPHEEIEGAR